MMFGKQRKAGMKALFGSMLIAVAVLAACPFDAAAQDYPARSVTILVPFAPGGGTDILARAVAQRLEQRLG